MRDYTKILDIPRNQMEKYQIELGMLCCSWLLNLIFSTMIFALLPEKVIHLLTRSTQQQQHAAMIFFVVSSQQIQNEEIYSNNMEKMSKCLKLHVQL